MLDLSPETETILEQEAAREGVSVDTLLRRTFAPQTASISPAERVKHMLAAWQRADNTPTVTPPTNNSNMTPSEALFQQWEQQAADMTEEERQAEDKLWQQFQEGVNAERSASNMRPVF
jgi:hypothetical protein